MNNPIYETTTLLARTGPRKVTEMEAEHEAEAARIRKAGSVYGFVLRAIRRLRAKAELEKLKSRAGPTILVLGNLVAEEE